MNFNEMNLIAPLVDAVKKSGYDTPTPIQTETIPLILEGKDILGCAQTGTGKTAAFVLPILQHLAKGNAEGVKPSRRPIRALILAPTRELAIQNYDAFVEFGKELSIKSAVVFGGVNQSRQVEALRRGVDVVVATPGRLCDLIRQGFISLNRLEIFVLDEADRMLDMGFIRDVKTVISLLPEKRQTLLFSATMPKEVEELALSLLRNPATVKISPVTSTVDKIEQFVYFLPRENKKDLLLHLLYEKGVSTALVFTRTKGGADQIARILSKNGIKAMAIHGNKSQNARQMALSSFKNGKISVLVATDIAARGIDISELPFVVNFNVPVESETYIHRIGRTGRAGLGGTAITLCSSDELDDWHAIEKLTKNVVPIGECPWSIKDMKATTPLRKQGGAGRNTGARTEDARRPSAGRTGFSSGEKSGERRKARPQAGAKPYGGEGRKTEKDGAQKSEKRGGGRGFKGSSHGGGHSFGGKKKYSSPNKSQSGSNPQ